MKTFKHGEGTGDLIYGLPTMKLLGGGILYINIMLWDIVKVLERQSYIQKVIYQRPKIQDKDWAVFPVDYDLDQFRQQNYNKYTISKCHLKAFGLEFDLSQPWLENIDPITVAPIVVNDTGGHPQKSRSPGNTVDWGVLEEYKKDCIFIGYGNEYDYFLDWRGINIKHHIVKDSLEFAQVILGSKLYVANQSLGSALAEAMKVNRVIDLITGPSKQYPLSNNGHTELTHELVRKYVYE